MTRKFLSLSACLLTTLCLINQANGAELRDPTQPSIYASTMGAELTDTWSVQGVFIGPTGRSALINNKWVKVGSTINGARILGIDRGRVVLLLSGHKKTLYLFGKLWKKI
jgi:hypothetical protein